MENSLITLKGRVFVGYSTFQDGEYLPFITVPLYREISFTDFVSYIRRNLLSSPTWVRNHVSCDFETWTTRFWFRIFTRVGYVYFFVDVSSSDLNSISSREAAL